MRFCDLPTLFFAQAESNWTASDPIIDNPALVDANLSAYNSILFPAKRDVRYSKFNQACKRIEGRVINNEHTYKRFLLMITKFEQLSYESEPIQGTKPSSVVTAPMLPPRKKRLSSGENINRSALKRRGPGQCSACRQKNVIPSDNHRARSKKCPFASEDIG
uniref:Uncharacterized protein n=1 Tax=Spongospora subterranea TaxID=70186 RepID=A0A0H5QT40_9EUKA|eukprot:CRZ04857.1 hypothetical protein [Spongospora subterranea]